DDERRHVFGPARGRVAELRRAVLAYQASRLLHGFDGLLVEKARPGARADRVAANAEAAEVSRDRTREADDPFLRRRIARLTVVSEAGFRSRVDDDARALIAKDRRRRSGGREVSLQVYGDHVVPVAFAHVVDDPRPDDAGVVHQNVEPAETLDRGGDDARRARHRGDVV